MSQRVIAGVITLAGLAFNGDDPPTEFRLFKAGINATTQGDFLFDAKAAEMVLAAQAAYGNDYAIDLEHLSIDKSLPSYDGDARGWFNLDVRNGELWAVNVRWTADGLRRLSEKTQRYISPALFHDQGRVAEIVNVALVATPSTHQTPALVAASRSLKDMQKLSNVKAVAALLATLSARHAIANAKLVKLASAPADGGGDAAQGKGAAMKSAAETAQTAIADLLTAADGSDMDVLFAAMATATKAMDDCENAIAAITGAPMEPADATPPPPDAAASAQEAKLSRVERAELLSYRKLEEKRAEDEKVAKLAAELTERTELEAELVKMGRETPATVKLLSALPLESMRERVKQFRGPAGAVKLGGPRVPVGSSPGDGSKDITTSRGVVVTLTANQLRECERSGAKPEAFAELQASRLPVKA